MYSYAQLNDVSVCISVSTLAAPIDRADMIPLEDADYSIVGKVWNGETFEDGPVVPAPAVRTLTKLQFRNRFTFAEKQAIYAAAEASVDIRIFLDDINAAEEINLDDPATQFGVMALEGAGLIATGRGAEILGE